MCVYKCVLCLSYICLIYVCLQLCQQLNYLWWYYCEALGREMASSSLIAWESLTMYNNRQYEKRTIHFKNGSKSCPILVSGLWGWEKKFARLSSQPDISLGSSHIQFQEYTKTKMKKQFGNQLGSIKLNERSQVGKRSIMPCRYFSF